MSNHAGYVKVFRQIEDWEWYTDANTFRVFMFCLFNANYSESKYCGSVIGVGEFVTSYKTISEKLKITWSQARTSIEHLKLTGEIAVKITNKFLIINVQKWAKYQGEENGESIEYRSQERTQIAPKSQASRTQIAPSEELKHLRIEELKESVSNDTPKKVVPSGTTPRFIPPTLDEVIAYCRERNNTVDPERWFNYYESNGWMVGKNKMKKWKAAVITWEKGGGYGNGYKNDRDDFRPNKTELKKRYGETL